MITNEDKKLLAVDLIGRQLYGLKFQYINNHGKTTIQTLESVICLSKNTYKVSGDKDVVDIENCKPYLFSKRTIENEINFYGKKICLLDILQERDIVIVQHRGTWIRAWEYDIIDYQKFYDTLDEFHVDYRGLIDNFIAIEINNNNNPYKND